MNRDKIQVVVAFISFLVMVTLLSSFLHFCYVNGRLEIPSFLNTRKDYIIIFLLASIGLLWGLESKELK